MTGRAALMLPEDFCVVAGALKSAGQGDFRNVHGGIGQEPHTDFQAVGI